MLELKLIGNQYVNENNLIGTFEQLQKLTVDDRLTMTTMEKFIKCNEQLIYLNLKGLLLNSKRF